MLVDVIWSDDTRAGCSPAQGRHLWQPLGPGPGMNNCIMLEDVHPRSVAKAESCRCMQLSTLKRVAGNQVLARHHFKVYHTLTSHMQARCQAYSHCAQSKQGHSTWLQSAAMAKVAVLWLFSRTACNPHAEVCHPAHLQKAQKQSCNALQVKSL